jgi:hypothetical protein
MAVKDVLEKIGHGAEKAAKKTGTVLGRGAEATGLVLGEGAKDYFGLNQVDPAVRQRQWDIEDRQIEDKSKVLDAQLAQLQSGKPLFKEDGTQMTPQERSQAITAISDQYSSLYSHPRHAKTLMERLRKIVAPKGAVSGGVPYAPTTPAAAMSFTEAAPEGYAIKQQEALDTAKEQATLRNIKQRQQLIGQLFPNATPEEQKQFGDMITEQGLGIGGLVQSIQKEKDVTAYRNAQLQFKQAAEELAQAKFAAQNDPSNLQNRIKLIQAESRASIARSLATRTEAQVFGTYGGTPISGAPTTTEGSPVGSMFGAINEPTSFQRGRGGYASSMKDQIATIKYIEQKRPDIFHPLSSQQQSLQSWFGTQDPDAQTVKSALDYIGEHGAIMAGSVSAGTQKAIKDAAGGLNMPTAVLDAALADSWKAASKIEQIGTVHTVSPGGRGLTALTNPSRTGAKPVHHVGEQVKLKNGQTITIKKVHPDGSFE